MVSLSQLPVECLERIIHHISSIPHYRTGHCLASLCQVNKRICNITTRFLYQNASFFYPQPYEEQNEESKRRSRLLLRTLISNIPKHNLHPTVILGLGIDSNNNDTPSPSPSGVNHLHVTHCLTLRTTKYTDYDTQGNSRDYTADELDYIHGQEFLDMYLTDRKGATCIWYPDSKEDLLRYYPNVVYREAVWSLAEPIFEQLERLSILLSDLRRYYNIIGRLEKLEHLDVRFDLILYSTCCAFAEPRMIRRDETLRLLIQFVKDHITFFPGRLKTVHLPYRNDYCKPVSPKTCSRSVRDEIYRILPTVYWPNTIHAAGWPKDMVHLSTIDLGHVKYDTLFPHGIDIQLFLQRCRGLRDITAPSLALGCFDWAVWEKKEMEIFGQDQGRFAAGSSPTPALTQVQHRNILSDIPPPPPPPPPPSQPAWSKHGLVKLQTVRFRECRMPSRDLDTITTAFSHSLKNIIIQDLQTANNAQTTHIHIGHDWSDMPIFEHLDLQTRNRENRVVLDPRRLARYPSIRYVNIKDETFDYSSQEIVPWLPADLPEVRTVLLRGWSALSFNPATLYSTKKLKDLRLILTRPNWYCYIPPVDELDEHIGAEDGGSGDECYGVPGSIVRPRWNWDWHLPALETLDLSSEFAYRFEFKMLHRCPNLEYLRLLMRTVEGLHTRVISEAHLFVPGVDGSLERIVAPKLRTLSMNDRWVIEDPSVLSQFLGSMFPKLKRLVAIGWEGVTLGSFVNTLRTTAGHINTVRTDLVEPSDEEVVELKLCSDSTYFYMKPKINVILRPRLFCSGREYVLFKE